jgi:hypothetical protein
LPPEKPVTYYHYTLKPRGFADDFGARNRVWEVVSNLWQERQESLKEYAAERDPVKELAQKAFSGS